MRDLLTQLLLPLITLYCISLQAAGTQEAWSDWSECSRSCGGGVQLRSLLTCASLSWKGKCITKKEHRLCNVNVCPAGSASFRTTQCSAYNRRQVAARSTRTWKPLPGHLGCELKCKSVEDAIVYSFGKAENGTRCSLDGTNVCLDGRCTIVGCDNILGSTKNVDACGVCAGRNLTCTNIKKTFSAFRPSSSDSGLAHVVTLPAGVTNVRVDDWTTARLAVQDGKGRWLLNGNGRYSWPGSYEIAGNHLHYTFVWSNETLTIPGPTNQELVIMVDFGAAETAKVLYEYRRPKPRTDGSSAAPRIVNERHPHQSSSGVKKKTTREGKRRPGSGKLSSAHRDKNVVKKNRGASDLRRKRVPIPLNCLPCKKTKNQLQHFCDSDFVVSAQVKGFQVVNDKVRYELGILRSYKNSVGLRSREFVWTTDNCHCPRLHLHGHYVIMGHVDNIYSKHESRLVINSNSFVRRLKENDRRERTLVRLARKHASNCNRIT